MKTTSNTEGQGRVWCPYPGCGFEGSENEVDEHRVDNHRLEAQQGSNLHHRPHEDADEL